VVHPHKGRDEKGGGTPTACATVIAEHQTMCQRGRGQEGSCCKRKKKYKDGGPRTGNTMGRCGENGHRDMVAQCDAVFIRSGMGTQDGRKDNKGTMAQVP
jgi:hypothetical protein